MTTPATGWYLVCPWCGCEAEQVKRPGLQHVRFGCLRCRRRFSVDTADVITADTATGHLAPVTDAEGSMG